MVGELLEGAGESYAIAIIGGAALSLLGVVERTTRDVDVLAFATRSGRRAWALTPPPRPLPVVLADAIRTVGRDLGLAEDWLNVGPALQWKAGLPPGLVGRITWKRYRALRVGVVGRTDLVCFKLFAAADDGPEGRHARDLAALAPTDAELRQAARWVKTQDATAEFSAIVDEVVRHVRARDGVR